MTPAFPWILGFLLVQIVGAIFARDVPAAAGELVTFVLEGIGLYLLVINVVRTPSTMRNVVWTLLIGRGLPRRPVGLPGRHRDVRERLLRVRPVGRHQRPGRHRPGPAPSGRTHRREEPLRADHADARPARAVPGVERTPPAPSPGCLRGRDPRLGCRDPDLLARRGRRLRPGRGDHGPAPLHQAVAAVPRRAAGGVDAHRRPAVRGPADHAVGDRQTLSPAATPAPRPTTRSSAGRPRTWRPSTSSPTTRSSGVGPGQFPQYYRQYADEIAISVKAAEPAGPQPVPVDGGRDRDPRPRSAS